MATVGDFRPCSYADSVGREVPARRASSSCVRPELSRILSSSSAASMTVLTDRRGRSASQSCDAQVIPCRVDLKTSIKRRRCAVPGPASAAASGLGEAQAAGRRARAMQVTTTDQSGSPDDALCRLPGEPLSRSRPPRLGRSLRSCRRRSASPNLDTAPARQGSAPAGKTERTESPNPLMLRPPIPETRRPGGRASGGLVASDHVGQAPRSGLQVAEDGEHPAVVGV